MPNLVKLTRRFWPWVLMLFIFVTFMDNPANAQSNAQATSTQRILVVSGHGYGAAPASQVEITLGLVGKGNSAQDTYGTLNQRTAALTQVLTSHQVKTIKSSNISLTPKYGRDGTTAKATYEGSQTVKFQLPASKIAVLDQAMAEDIDRLQQIRYFASEEAITTARNQALTAAIDDAKAQAKVALDQLGFKTKEIVDIRIDHAKVASIDTPPVTDKSYSSGSRSKNLPVDAGEQTVDVHVTIQVMY